MPERLFLALWPDPFVSKALDKLGHSLHREFGGRCIPQNNIHLTLAFLGSVTAESRTALEQALCVDDIPSFQIPLDTLGFLKRPQVVWIGCKQTPQALTHLVKRVRETILPLPVAQETRPFLTHITLLRKVRNAANFPQTEPINWTVSRVVLVKSTTLPSGAEYEPVKEWALSQG